MSRWMWFGCMVGLVACDPGKDDTSAADFGGYVLDEGGGDDSGIAEGPVTWFEHVKPMMDKYCTRCHNDGGLGAGNFKDIESVKGFAELMLSRIDSGEMPPPVSDPDCRDYVGSSHLQMPIQAREAFAAWIEGGKLDGDPADAPEPFAITDTLADPDLVLTIPAPYTPLYEDEANPGNEYRCFVIDPEIEETRYITAMAPMVDQKAMVHHIVLFTKDISQISASEQGPDGYDCIDGGMADGVNGMVAGWAPGALPVEFPQEPESFGMRLGVNDRLIMQMHYFQSGPDVVGLADQSGYSFRTQEDVDRTVMMYPLGTTDFTIPAGDPAYTAGFEWDMPAVFSFDILAVFPHMHMLGTGYKMWVDTAEAGRQCLAQSSQYDFDNQLTYLFNEPVSIQGGDTIGFDCTWDNSVDNPNQHFDVPQDIGYGERTNEEMCYAFTLIGI
jgi:hypothetical protein